MAAAMADPPVSHQVPQVAYIGSTEHRILVQQAEAQVKDAIQLLPETRKQAYLTALEKCPHLVKSESSAVNFLRYCDYNVWQAAERLVLYWEERLASFGPERAFLPMVQTGKGALAPDDLVALHAGFFVPLPPTSDGRDVMFIDRTKALLSASRETRVRCLFYMLQMFSNNERSQKEGILVFLLLITPRVGQFDPTFAQRGLYLGSEVFPIKINLHFLSCPPKSGKRALIQGIVQTAVRLAVSAYGPKTQLHTESTKADLLRKLEGLGLSRQSIPVSVGGQWKYEEFAKWCRKKITMERLDMRVDDKGNASELQEPKATVVAPTQAMEEIQTTNPSKALDKNERKRMVNVIHSRQKRERRKAEQTMLQQECQLLEVKRRRLTEENERLQSLWDQAQTIVAAADQCRNGARPPALAASLPTVRPSSDSQVVPGVTAQYRLQSLSERPQNNSQPLQNVQQEQHWSAMSNQAAPNDEQAMSNQAARSDQQPVSVGSEFISIASNLNRLSGSDQLALSFVLLQNNPQLASLLPVVNAQGGTATRMPLQQPMQQATGLVRAPSMEDPVRSPHGWYPGNHSDLELSISTSSQQVDHAQRLFQQAPPNRNLGQILMQTLLGRSSG